MIIRMAQQDFEGFCRDKGLDDDTRRLLAQQRIGNTGALLDLRDDDVDTDEDFKKLPLGQRRRLQRVIKELKESNEPEGRLLDQGFYLRVICYLCR